MLLVGSMGWLLIHTDGDVGFVTTSVVVRVVTVVVVVDVVVLFTPSGFIHACSMASLAVIRLLGSTVSMQRMICLASSEMVFHGLSGNRYLPLLMALKMVVSLVSSNGRAPDNLHVVGG
jgi:hypothetical protein